MIVVVERRPDAVGGVVHLEPLAGRDLVRAERAAHLVVEDLRRRARERGEPDVAQPLQVVVEREPERGRALPDLERREGVDVQVGQRLLHRRADLQVRLAGEGGVDAALEAELDGAAVPGLRARRTISSSGTTYGAPRRFAASLPFEKAQKPQRK